MFIILGHAKPFFFGFRGGKGVACSLGIMAAISYKIAIIGFIIYVVLLILTKKSSVGSLVGTMTSVLVYLFYDKIVIFKAFLIFLLLTVAFLHKDNIKRISDNKEKTAI